MAGAGEEVAAGLARVARDLAAQAIGLAQAQVDTIVAEVEGAVGAAEAAAKQVLELPEELLAKVKALADQQDPLGTLMWLMVRLADSLAPAGVRITAFDPAPGTGRPRSLAVTYTRDEVALALALSTATPPGGALVLTAHGNGGGPVDVVAGPVHVHVEGATEEGVSIPFAAGVTVAAHAAVTVLVELTSAPAAGGGDTSVRLGRPALTVVLEPSVDGFRYRGELAMRDNGLHLDLMSMLGDLAQVISLPSIDESVDVVLTLDESGLALQPLAGAAA